MLEPQLGMGMTQLVDTSKLTEDLGFGYLFRSDHLLPTDGRRGIDSPECWTSLGAIAGATTSLKFGPMVTPVGFRNPALLARMASTLHSFSGGRLQLSIGAGWYEPEYKANGYPFPSFSERRGQFCDALAIIIPLVRQGKVDFDGKYFSAHTDLYPRPLGDLHLIIGGRSKSMVRFAAREADEWNFLGAPLEVYTQLKSVLDSIPGSDRVQVSETNPFLIGRNQADLEASARMQISKLGMQLSPQELLARLKTRNAPCGKVEDFVEQVRTKADSGVRKIYFQTLVPENTGMIELLADTLGGKA